MTGLRSASPSTLALRYAIEFVELCRLLGRLGFEERVRGDHHIFTRNGVTEIINLQPKGNKAKAYQVRQIRGILVKYRLGEGNVD